MVKLLPEANQANNQSGNLGGLAGLVSLAGINIGGANANLDIINPSLYPNLVESSPFLLELIKSNIYNPNLKKWQTILDYLNEKMTMLPCHFQKYFQKKKQLQK